MSNRRTAILRAINAGNFALCHLFDLFGTTYDSLRRHIKALHEAGLIFVDGTGDQIRFSMTAAGQQALTPVKTS